MFGREARAGLRAIRFPADISMWPATFIPSAQLILAALMFLREILQGTHALGSVFDLRAPGRTPASTAIRMGPPIEPDVRAADTR